MSGYNFSAVSALVVDDHHFMRTLLSEVLSNFGFRRVMTAADGSAAVQMLRRESFDIAFVDWKMPDLDGIEFTQGVRSGAFGRDPYLPIVMVSGYTDERRVMAALDAGVHSYLLKPVTPTSIGARITQLIESPPRFIKTDSYFGPYRPRRTASPAD